MAQIYLRAITLCIAPDEHGKLKTYHPGDWFKVGKQKARELVELRQAEIPDSAQAGKALTEDLSECGVYVREGSVKDVSRAMGRITIACEESGGGLRLPYERTLIWHTRIQLDRKAITLGFLRVEDTGKYNSWEVAAMLRGPDILAADIGGQVEQRRTKALTGDLRLPVYETAAVWVRKTAATEKLIAAWDAEMKDSTCEEQAFLRALYSNRVLMCTLPAQWLGRWLRV